jgi:hypothetical protein
MKLILEKNDGSKIVVENKAIEDSELDVDNLPVLKHMAMIVA